MQIKDSAATFGYAYPETQKWQFASTADYQEALRRTVSSMYGSNVFRSFAASTAVSRRVAVPEDKDAEILEDKKAESQIVENKVAETVVAETKVADNKAQVANAKFPVNKVAENKQVETKQDENKKPESRPAAAPTFSLTELSATVPADTESPTSSNTDTESPTSSTDDSLFADEETGRTPLPPCHPYHG